MKKHPSAANVQAPGAGDAARGGRAVLELRVAEMRQLFNAMDPAPFRERDLDPNAEAYIVDWVRETRAGQSLGVLVQLGRERATADQPCQSHPVTSARLPGSPGDNKLASFSAFGRDRPVVLSPNSSHLNNGWLACANPPKETCRP